MNLYLRQEPRRQCAKRGCHYCNGETSITYAVSLLQEFLNMLFCNHFLFSFFRMRFVLMVLHLIYI